jgi:hypothetical protein
MAVAVLPTEAGQTALAAAQALARNAAAPATLRAYRADWRHFADWWTSQGPDAPFFVSGPFKPEPLILIEALLRTMPLDHLRFFVIQQRQFAARPAFGTEQLVELGVNRLGVPVLSALDDQGHEPGGDRGDGMPVEAARVEDQPRRDVDRHDHKRGRMGGQYTHPGQHGAMKWPHSP